MNKFSNKKKIILGSIIGVLIGTLLSTSYAFFTYTRTGTSNNQLVTGNIWMRYGETNTLTLNNAMPSDTYDSSQKFEFTIDGANTTTDKDIWYEIKIKHGTIPTGTPTRSENDRIPDRFIKYKLVKEENNVSKVVVDGESWQGLDIGKTIYVDKIEKNKQTVNHKYTLYMWISSELQIGNQAGADFTIENWNKAFASIRVDVNGDFIEKKVDPNQTVNVMNSYPNGFFTTSTEREGIKEIYFNKMSASAMQTAYNNATKKADLTYNDEGRVLGWVEGNKLYIASDGKTYLTTGENLFAGFKNLEKIEFNNVDTSRVTTMKDMFAGCSNLENLNLSNLGGSILDNVTSMFNGCSKLKKINMSNFNFGTIATMHGLTQATSPFAGLTSLETVNLSNSIINNVTNISGMFSGCSALTNVNLSGCDTSNVTNMSGMFANCEKLTSIDLSNLGGNNLMSIQNIFTSSKDLKNVNMTF